MMSAIVLVNAEGTDSQGCKRKYQRLYQELNDF